MKFSEIVLWGTQSQFEEIHRFNNCPFMVSTKEISSRWAQAGDRIPCDISSNLRRSLGSRCLSILDLPAENNFRMSQYETVLAFKKKISEKRLKRT